MSATSCRMFEANWFKFGVLRAGDNLDLLPGFVGRAAVDRALRLVTLSGDRLIERALCNTAHAMLTRGFPIEALASAVAAVRCGGGTHSGRQKALYRAGAACAALSQPQAALFFLDQARFPSICHCSASRRPRSTSSTRHAFPRYVTAQPTAASQAALHFHVRVHQFDRLSAHTCTLSSLRCGAFSPGAAIACRAACALISCTVRVSVAFLLGFSVAFLLER